MESIRFVFSLSTYSGRNRPPRVTGSRNSSPSSCAAGSSSGSPPGARLEKLDKSSQDTLSLLVARSGTKRNRPPPSEKLAFQTPPADFAKCRRLQSVLFTLYPISPGSHIYPGTRRDIAALVAVGRDVVEVSTSLHQRRSY